MSSSDDESYDSDEGSAVHDESSVDIEAGFEYVPVPEANQIRMGEFNLLPLNRPDKTILVVGEESDHIALRETWNENDWERLGRDVAGNEYLTEIEIGNTVDSTYVGALNDQNMISFFQGLTRSNSIRFMTLILNGFGMEGVQAMVPFCKNASNLTSLNINVNNIGSQGFSLLWRALRDSPIESLWCGWCDVESIEIDENCIPKCLKKLNLSGNNINSDGCRELTKLLLKKDATLEVFCLRENNIDDEGVAILVDALRKNNSLIHLSLDANERISTKGKTLMLKLVNDISSIKSTLESNHSLLTFGSSFQNMYVDEASDDIIRNKITVALDINRLSMYKKDRAAEAGKLKVISTQLNSEERTSLCQLQEVNMRNEALYSEINPLHLPEVLELVGRNHGHSELYVALVSSIAGLFSTINRKKRLQDRLQHHLSIIQTLRTEIAAIEEAEESRSVGFKRRRT